MNTVLQEHSALPRYPKRALFPRLAALTNEIMGKCHESRPGCGAYKRYIRAAELREQAGDQKRAAKLYEKAGDKVDDWHLYSHAAWLLEKTDHLEALRIYEKAILSCAKRGDELCDVADNKYRVKALAKDAAVLYGHASELSTEASRLCLRAANLLSNPRSRKVLELKNLSDEFLARASDLKSKKAKIESEVSHVLL